MHHLPLPGVRVSVCVCVSYVACVAASGNCFVICVARGKAQRAKLQADNCQAAVKERVRREGGRSNRQTAFGACFAFGAAAKYATQNTLQYTAENMYFYLRATTRRMSNGACNVPQKICDIFTV